MKITFTSNKSMTDFINRKNGEVSFSEDIYLYNLFSRRGHEVTYIHPGDIKADDSGVYFASEWKLNGGENQFTRDISSVSTEQINENSRPDADVVFIRGLGEDESSKFQNERTFFNHLFNLENQVSLMLNSARTTYFELKPEQKKLDLPFIESWRVDSRDELYDLIKEENGVVLKPDIGFMARGVEYLSPDRSLESISEEVIRNSSFERVNSSKQEDRYIVMAGKPLFAQEFLRSGDVGKEKTIDTYFVPFEKQKLDVVYDAIDQTGLFYGAIDFKGDHLLEINGSGTGLGTIYGLYNLASTICKSVEDKYNSL
ncbi:MAG: hypothetical protein ACLFSN_03500 [Candidatus Woesearchaeota archaeon]